MKINELKQLQEGIWDNLKTLASSPEKKADAAKSKAYTSYKKKFIDDMNQYFTNAVSSGMVDPSISGTEPGTDPTTDNSSPGASAFGQMSSNLTSPPQPTKQSASTMANTTVSKTNTVTPGNPNATPSNPPPSGSGGVQGIKSNVDVSKLQKFNGIVDVTPKIQPPPQVKDAKGRTWTKTSAGWTDGKREIDRQDSTYLAFDDAWRVANGAEAGNVGVPGSQQQQATQSPQPSSPAGGVGPKGRETLARLGKQKQTRENPAQGALDLNENIFDDTQRLNKLVERLVENKNYLTEAMSPSQAIEEYISNKTKGVDISKYKEAFDKLSSSFEAEYVRTKKFPTEIANKIFDYFYSVMSSNTIERRQKQPSNLQPPANIDPADIMSKISKIDPTDPQKIGQALVSLATLLAGNPDVLNQAIAGIQQAQQAANKP